jgi:uncharacterized protein YxeA
MNKFKIGSIAVIVIIVLVGLIYVKKQWFDDGNVFTTPTISADKVTRLSAAGHDMRLYEFTPQTAPYMQCIFIAGESKGSSFCFEKKDYVANNQTTP